MLVRDDPDPIPLYFTVIYSGFDGVPSFKLKGFPADYDGEPVWYPIIVFDQELLIQEISEYGFELDNAGMQINVPSPLPNGIVFLITSGTSVIYLQFDNGWSQTLLPAASQYLDEYYHSEGSSPLHPMRMYVSWNGLFRRMD